MERFIAVEIFRKKVIPFEVLTFSRFYRNDRNFLYHLSGLLVPMIQLNPVPVFGVKKNTSTI